MIAHASTCFELSHMARWLASPVRLNMGKEQCHSLKIEADAALLPWKQKLKDLKMVHRGARAAGAVGSTKAKRVGIGQKLRALMRFRSSN